MKTRNFVIKDTMWNILNSNTKNISNIQSQNNFISCSSSFKSLSLFQNYSNQKIKLNSSFSKNSMDKRNISNMKQLSTFSSLSRNKNYSNNISRLITHFKKNSNENLSNNLEKNLNLLPNKLGISHRNFENKIILNTEKKPNNKTSFFKLKLKKSNLSNFSQKKTMSNSKEKKKEILSSNKSKSNSKVNLSIYKRNTNNKKVSKLLSSNFKYFNSKSSCKKMFFSPNKKYIKIRQFENIRAVNIKIKNEKKIKDLKNKMNMIEFNLNAKRYQFIKKIFFEKEELINSKLNYSNNYYDENYSILSIKKNIYKNFILDKNIILNEKFEFIKTIKVNNIELGLSKYLTKYFDYSKYLPLGLNDNYRSKASTYLLENFKLKHKPSIINYFNIPKLNLIKSLLTPENMIYCQKFLKLEMYLDKVEKINYEYKNNYRVSIQKQIKIIKKIQAKNNNSTNIGIKFNLSKQKLENFKCFQNKNNILYQPKRKTVIYESNIKTQINKKRIPIIIKEELNPTQIWNEIKKQLIQYNIKNFFKLYNKNGKDIKINYQNENGNTLLILASIYNLEEICLFLLRKGADPNLQNIFGNSALHYTISNKFFKLTNLLIQFNANEDLINEQGLTPWECINSFCEYVV